VNPANLILPVFGWIDGVDDFSDVGYYEQVQVLASKATREVEVQAIDRKVSDR
jgi:hypothetical protein